MDTGNSKLETGVEVKEVYELDVYRLAEGYGRYTPADRRKFYLYARCLSTNLDLNSTPSSNPPASPSGHPMPPSFEFQVSSITSPTHQGERP